MGFNTHGSELEYQGLYQNRRNGTWQTLGAADTAIGGLTEQAGLLVLFILAFANGANDVGKSVAIIVEASPGRPVRRALIWGGLFSGFGSVFAVLLAQQLLSVFRQALLTPTPTQSFVLAVLAGTTIWVLGATLLRLTVSLSHAIVGAIIFEAVYLFGFSYLNWTYVGERVLLPLAGGPFAAFILTYLLHRLKPVRPKPEGQQAAQPGKPGKLVSSAHWLSAALTAFARGVNDAPKMVAVGLFLLPLGLQSPPVAGYLFVALAVFCGSIIWGRRVTQTLVGRIPALDHESRVRAGVATAALVSVGALFGAPLSTTHMTAGATAGIGGGRKEHVRAALKGFLLAWLITLPAAGLLSIGATMAKPWIRSIISSL